jgi:hypothetical protein
MLFGMDTLNIINDCLKCININVTKHVKTIASFSCEDLRNILDISGIALIGICRCGQPLQYPHNVCSFTKHMSHMDYDKKYDLKEEKDAEKYKYVTSFM